MPRKNTPYANRAWPHLRIMVFRRDGYTCQIKGKNCTHVATTVDHIVPWRPDHTGGAWLDPLNLRAACRACNLGHAGRDTSIPNPSRKW